jgi:peptide/nickel transport system substrate-binding protein
MNYLKTATAAVLAAALNGPALAAPSHGIAMQGQPGLAPDFKSLPYANPEAPQGGTLRQAVVGTFDSLNPFIVKGNAARDVRTYTFESLMGRNGAEPFSLYCWLCESIDVSEDRQIFTFRLRPQARFSDGSPVTAADVVFSMETLRDHGRPNFKNSYGKVKSVETPDEHTIVFKQDAGDRELPLLIGLMPVFSKKAMEGRNFEEASLQPIIGSGPYVVGDVKPDEAIAYTRNPNWWGKDIAFNRGLWNFDSVRFDYYRDANAAFEAFKKGDADFRLESDPLRWATAYDFPAVTEGKIIKEFVAQKTPAAATGFGFNLRRKIFDDVRVREALVMAFDFEWANANLFSGQFKRTYGYFGGSALSSEGKPASAGELAIIGSDGGGLRQDYRDGSYKLPVSDGSGLDRKMLRKAVDMLKQAGWGIKDGKMMNGAGEAFAFAVTLQTDEQQKMALHYQRTLQQIGIAMDIKRVDAAQFSAVQKTYDYDMIPVAWFNSLSPGNEQKLYFGSEGRTKEGTRNYPGVADTRVDAAIEAMVQATTREAFEEAVRAEDRLLVSGHYIVPFYNAGGHWVARWNHIGRPEAQPVTGFEATTLWRNPQ